MIARRRGLFLLGAGVAAMLVAGCGPSAEPAALDDMPVAVSSPYLEAAVTDVLGWKVPLVRLAGPGMCPGHFDIRPSQIRELSKCRLLVRFDFQEGLDKKIAGRTDGTPRTVVVEPPGGLCVPDTYLAVCRRLAEHFVADGTLSQKDADARLAEIERRAAALRKEAVGKIDSAGLRDAPVLCGGHQSEFCRWLGLRVAAEFPSAEAASTGRLDRAVRDADAAGVRLIVANEPEGRRAADALADRLHARVVVFANFPEPGKQRAFDAMVRRNLSALTAATEQP
ncbi:MAG: hypothetical protein L6306_10790 [Planctomycetales bacterium]|nr:hypothetical protein [Planctomycetales bacterium]